MVSFVLILGRFTRDLNEFRYIYPTTYLCFIEYLLYQIPCCFPRLPSSVYYDS